MGVGVAMEREVGVSDVELEVLGHLVPVDDGADLRAISALPRSGLRGRETAAAMAARSCSVGRGQQVQALAGALAGEIGIADRRRAARPDSRAT